MSNERLANEITELAGHINAATCRWLELIAEFDRRDAWAEWGMKSCAHWISWCCALAPGPAREHVRVARRLDQLPLIRAAFARGELSYSKVRALTRIEAVAEERALLEMAEDATAAELERIIQAYRGVIRAEDADRVHEERFVSLVQEPDGSWRLRGSLTAEDGALLARALDAARDDLRQSDARLDVPAGTHAASDSGGARNAAETTAAGAMMAERSPIPPEGARRIACDASVVRMTEREGRTIAVGHKTRSIPPALRRALLRRDPCCRFPGCTQRRALDGHHIVHWAHGGRTELDNLVHLCRHHHRLLHEGGFTLDCVRDALVFRTPGGQSLPVVPRLRRGDCGALRGRSAHIRPDTCRPGIGEPFDLGTAVDRVLVGAPP